MSRFAWIFVVFLGALGPQSAQAQSTIDFEGLSDSTVLAAQIPGLTFSNAMVLTSGITLNEFEFPPHSGSNVAIDDGAAMQIVFDSPVTLASAFFTYSVPLTLTAFDGAGNVVTTVQSLFSSNLALSGVAGSSPNERIDVAAGAGAVFSRLVIAGDTGGASFAVDDLSVTLVPEPSTLASLLFGLVVLATRKRRGGLRTGRGAEVLRAEQRS